MSIIHNLKTGSGENYKFINTPLKKKNKCYKKTANKKKQIVLDMTLAPAGPDTEFYLICISIFPLSFLSFNILLCSETGKS